LLLLLLRARNGVKKFLGGALREYVNLGIGITNEGTVRRGGRLLIQAGVEQGVFLLTPKYSKLLNPLTP
jgi:hypothetical protein